MKMRISLNAMACACAALSVALFTPQTGHAADLMAQAEIAAAPPMPLLLEITSTCDAKGGLFKITNRGGKWPRTGNLKLYYADDNTLIGERRLRLADNQRVSFKIKDKVMVGRPVAVWVEPAWYRREFKFDAALNCK